MKNYTSVYKKKFKEVLAPYGYSSRGMTFYKLEDEVFFTIHIRRRNELGFSCLDAFIGVDVYHEWNIDNYFFGDWVSNMPKYLIGRRG